jgi:hypothetical protein
MNLCHPTTRAWFQCYPLARAVAVFLGQESQGRQGEGIEEGQGARENRVWRERR